MKKKRQTKKIGWIIGLLSFQIAPLAILLFYLYSFKTYNEEPGWLTNNEGTCRFYTQRNREHRSFIWTGTCKNGLVHGQGKLTVYEDNRKLYDFEGLLIEGKINGPGALRWAFDGDVYEGNFLDSELNGYGRFYNDDGDHYEGHFVNWLRSGEGTYWYEPESRKFKYIGNWKDDKPHGFGTLYYRDGRMKQGLFEQGVFVNESTLKPHAEDSYPKNVLITNDDGVEDMDRLVCLAEALSEKAEMVVVVASSSNRSGTSNTISINRKGSLTAKLLSIDTERNIYVYEADGYPSDCVLLGSMGIFQKHNTTIDLVISGINGGANAGADWYGSGTIGAARTAAMAGIPAIAVSGVNEDEPNKNNLGRLCKWVAHLAGSTAVKEIRPYEYLTVSIPEDLDEIKGVKVVERAITFDSAPFYFENEEATDADQIDKEVTWQLRPINAESVYKMPAENDVFYYSQGYIVIVPMSVDENNASRIEQYGSYESELWTWFAE